MRSRPSPAKKEKRFIQQKPKFRFLNWTKNQMADDYQDDVFFSYKRHELTADWTWQVARRLKLWISEELGGRPAIPLLPD